MEYPALKDDVQFAIFMRKWEYQFAYAEAGFLKGYLACHMLTFIRTVSLNRACWARSHRADLYFLTVRTMWPRLLKGYYLYICAYGIVSSSIA